MSVNCTFSRRNRNGNLWGFRRVALTSAGSGSKLRRLFMTEIQRNDQDVLPCNVFEPPRFSHGVDNLSRCITAEIGIDAAKAPVLRSRNGFGGIDDFQGSASPYPKRIPRGHGPLCGKPSEGVGPCRGTHAAAMVVRFAPNSCSATETTQRNRLKYISPGIHSGSGGAAGQVPMATGLLKVDSHR